MSEGLYTDILERLIAGDREAVERMVSEVMEVSGAEKNVIIGNLRYASGYYGDAKYEQASRELHAIFPEYYEGYNG